MYVTDIHNFNIKTLLSLTTVLVLMGLASFSDADHGAAVLMLAGFLYTAVLYISMVKKPLAIRFVLGLLILGISNLFVFYSFAVLMFLPKEFVFFLKYLPSSLLGAFITVMILKKLWKINISGRDSLFIYLFVSIAALSSPILLSVISRFHAVKGFMFSFNSILWWLAFSLAITVIQMSANKRLNQITENDVTSRE